MGYYKKRIKIIENLCENFLKRTEKIKELVGTSLEPEHLKNLNRKKKMNINGKNQIN